MEEKNWRYFSDIINGLRDASHYLADIGHFEKSIELMNILTMNGQDYESGDWAYELALIYEKWGRLDKAKEYFTIAVEENPGWGKFADAAKRYNIPIPKLPT